MATLVSSQSLAAAATVSSSSTAFAPGSVVVATCLNGTPGPSYSCMVQLFISMDNVNFVQADQRIFGMGPGQGYRHEFELVNFTGAAFGGQPNAAQQIGGVAIPSNFKVTFTGTPDQAVTVAAISYP